MHDKILVNKIEIEKTIINKFLIQNRKLEAVKYICEKANIGLAASKEIVELFQAGSIDNFDHQDLFDTSGHEKVLTQTSRVVKHQTSDPKTKKYIILFLIFLLAGFLFIKYVIGFQNIFTSKSNLEEALDVEVAEGTNTTSTTDYAQDAPTSPVDTLIWVNAIKNNEYIPEDVLEDIENYKKRDFSKLVIAYDKPSDKQAEKAIIYYLESVTTLLKQYNATIKIGVCYNAPLKDENKEIARVTAMVSAFNRDGNLGNIQAPLDVIYDFVKYKDNPNTWKVADFSQNIPYDYVLNKERW